MKHVLLVGNLDGQSAPLLRYASKFCKELKLKLHILQIEPNSNPILLSSPYYYNKFGLMMHYNSSEKKEELENFVLKNTKNLIDSTWISCKIIRGNVEHSLTQFGSPHHVSSSMLGRIRDLSELPRIQDFWRSLF